jgi:type II secretory ATPase GspE/PulE/Tfp pilus assembly ATPase PilB-like protein
MKTLSDFSEDRPFDQVLKPIIAHAKLSKATDIYFDSKDDHAIVRLRIDGAIDNTQLDLSHAQLKTLVQQLKIHFRSDPTQMHTEGAVEFEFGTTNVELRVHAMHTSDGYSMIMRFGQDAQKRSLKQLGLDDAACKLIKKKLQIPEGMIIITGPTASGKTTLCASMVQQMDSKDNRTVLIEDTKELNVDLSYPIHIVPDPKRNFNFNTVLNAALRLRPNTIVVGETRDKQTARAIYQAATAGHRVITTFHAHNPVSALQRLESFGVDSYELGKSTNLIISLERALKLCPSCRKKVVLTSDLIDYLDLLDRYDFKAGDIVYKRNKDGCNKCNHRGTLGRAVVYDILEVDDAIEQAIAAKDYQKIKNLRDPQFTFKAVRERLIRSGDIGL